MNKFLILLVIILLIVLGVIFRNNSNFGGGLNVLPTGYSSGSTNSSTTFGVSATSILARNVDRQWAKICNDSLGIVWIYETATATGVVVNMGTPIASSTAYEHCYTIDTNHPYTGQVYGIGSTTTTIKYIER